MQKEPTPALLPSRLLFPFQYFVFDFHIPPDVMFDKIIKLSVSEHGCVYPFHGALEEISPFCVRTGDGFKVLDVKPPTGAEVFGPPSLTSFADPQSLFLLLTVIAGSMQLHSCMRCLPPWLISGISEPDRRTKPVLGCV